MTAEDMIILTRTYDLLAWLMPRVARFPKPYRTTTSQRTADVAHNFTEALYDANAHSGVQRLAYLRLADAHLNKLRLYLRLAHRFEWLSSGQYEHVSRMVAEIGRLLGGWIRQTLADLK